MGASVPTALSAKQRATPTSPADDERPNRPGFLWKSGQDFIGAIGGAWLCGWRFAGPCAVSWAAWTLLGASGQASVATSRRRAARRRHTGLLAS